VARNQVIDSCCLIIPYYNERNRLDTLGLLNFIDSVNRHTIFVDDGSTDDSSSLIEQLISTFNGEAKQARAELLKLSGNVGKTNAIRESLLFAHTLGFTHAVISDIDLPIKASDLEQAIAIAFHTRIAIVSGARVRLSGNDVKRTSIRHWIGRIIATLIWKIFAIDSYDIQSPCKVYNLALISQKLERQFATKWFGDVELLFRLKAESGNAQSFVHEFSLYYWRDVRGGKLRLTGAFHVFLDLCKLQISRLRE